MNIMAISVGVRRKRQAAVTAKMRIRTLVRRSNSGPWGTEGSESGVCPCLNQWLLKFPFGLLLSKSTFCSAFDLRDFVGMARRI